MLHDTSTTEVALEGALILGDHSGETMVGSAE